MNEFPGAKDESEIQESLEKPENIDSLETNTIGAPIPCENMKNQTFPETDQVIICARGAYKTPLIILSLVLTLVGVLALSLVIYTRDTGQIVNGIVLEVPLGGLTVDEARCKLESIKTEKNQTPLTFIADGKNILIKAADLGLVYSYEKPLSQAAGMGREGSLTEKALGRFYAGQGIRLHPDLHWDESVLKDTLQKNLLGLTQPAEDAYFVLNQDNSLAIVPEKAGKHPDLELLAQTIRQAPILEEKTFAVPFKTLSPRLAKTDLEGIRTDLLLAEYRTSFNSFQQERTHNVALAAKSLDRKVIKPGEVFSFNQTVGPRTAEAGYREALIIEQDRFVPGLGGGVCQVSSTLFNAVRLSSPSLSVTERSPHSLPVSYVPPGQDATVAYPYLDFKFKNESAAFLLIRSFIQGSTLTFRIYGQKK